MGISRSPEEMAAKLRGFANDLGGRLENEATSAAALEYTDAVRKAYRVRTGDGKMSGVGLRGAKVGARFDAPKALGGNAIVRATGPAHLIESNTKAHVIATRRRRGKKAIVTPYGPRRSVQHPGTRGRPTFFPTVLAKTPQAARAFQSKIHNGLVKRFG